MEDNDKVVSLRDRKVLTPQEALHEEVFRFMNGAAVTVKAADGHILTLPETVFLLEAVKWQLMNRSK